MTAPRPISDADWEVEARRLEPLVDGLSAVVLVGSDPAAVAEIAVELGRAQALRRRVTVGDLVGGLPALERLIAHDDPHGLSDALDFGISLGRIAHPVPDVPNLFVATSGTQPVDSESVFAHPRWPRIVSAVRAKGGLLMLVAEATAPGVERLIAATDGAIVVGDTPVVFPSAIIARTPPRGVRRLPDAYTLPTASPPPQTPAVADVAQIPSTPVPTPDATPRWRELWSRVSHRSVVAGVLVGVAVIAIVAIRSWRSQRDARAAFGAPIAAAAPAADPPPPVENPEDEEDASAYSLVLRTANTPAGASDNLKRLIDLPAATMAPSIDDAGLWYKVLAGAYRDRAQAESLGTALRASGRVAEDGVSLAFLPFALVLADSVGADSASAMTARFRERGIPAYALVQGRGQLRIFAGAFATPGEAMHLAQVIRAAGVRPRIAYRTGRPQ